MRFLNTLSDSDLILLIAFCGLCAVVVVAPIPEWVAGFASSSSSTVSE